MAEYKILDVSCHNGNVDFTQVKKAGYTGVILRAGFGKSITQKDKCFDTYYKDAKSAGLNVGAYWYSYSKTSSEALLEAKTFLQAIKNCQLELPCYYDIEDKTQIALSKTICTEMVDTFCKYLESNKYWAGVYSYDSFFGSNLDISIQTRYAIWVARVDGKKPQFCKTYQGWQNSWIVKIPNHTCDFDSSIFTVDYSSLIKSKKLNGFDNAVSVNTTTQNSNISVSKYLVDYQNEQKSQVIEYDHLTQGNLNLSPHFKIREFKCPTTNTILIDNRLIWILERLYKDLNLSKCVITSGYRTPQYSISVGGYATDKHTTGEACDFQAFSKDGKIIDAKLVCCKLCDYGDVFGIAYISENSTHIDTRNKSQIWFGNEKTGESIIKLGYTCFQDYWKINSDGSPRVTYKLTAIKDNLTETEANQLKTKLVALGISNVDIKKV